MEQPLTCMRHQKTYPQSEMHFIIDYDKSEEQPGKRIALELTIKNKESKEYKYTIKEIKDEKLPKSEQYNEDDLMLIKESIINSNKNDIILINYDENKTQRLFITIDDDNKKINNEVELSMIVKDGSHLFAVNETENVVTFIKYIKKVIVKGDKGESAVCFRFYAIFENIENDFPYFEISNSEHLLFRSESVHTKEQFSECSIPEKLIKNGFSIIFFNNNKVPITKFNGDDIESFLNNPECKTLPFPLGGGIVTLYNNSYYQNNSLPKTIINDKFTEYLNAGLKFHISIAIDFTASNERQTSPYSRHFIKEEYNEYEKAIVQCGELFNKNTDGMFSVYGFGANGSGNVSCFNLNQRTNPDIHTIDNIINIYRTKSPKLELAYPSDLSPVIEHCLERITEENDKSYYHVLYIIMDGGVDDIDETVASLVKASSMPLSVVIVGIGKSFERVNTVIRRQMKSNDITAEREVAMFIRSYTSEQQSEVSNKIADSVLEYMNNKKITPDDIHKFIVDRHYI